MSYLRHTLCYLNKQAQPLSTHKEEEVQLLMYWLEKSFPLIVPRQAEQSTNQTIHLALPYFNNRQRKIRYIYCFAKEQIVSHQELPLVKEVFPKNKSTSAVIRVYGSYCWQYLTQHPYVQDTSDVDLLLNYEGQTITQLARLYAELKEQLTHCPIDGEVRFPNLGDCSWKELIRKEDSSSILIKSSHHLSLLDREHVYALFPTLLS